jgi:hypothetical protein
LKLLNISNLNLLKKIIFWKIIKEQILYWKSLFKVFLSEKNSNIYKP